MKKLILGFIVLASSVSFLMSDTYVNGYTKSNGTYVQGHYRSSPNSTTSDNYSTVGNTNPYTGQAGTKQNDYNYNNYNYNNSNSNKGYGLQNPYGK